MPSKQLKLRCLILLGLLLFHVCPCSCFLKPYYPIIGTGGTTCRNSNAAYDCQTSIKLHYTAASSFALRTSSSTTSNIVSNEHESSLATDADAVTNNIVNKDDGSLVAAKESVNLGKFQSTITKIGMLTFVGSMCVALPLTLLPINILHRFRLISTRQREFASLWTGKFCSRWLLCLIPFINVQIIHDGKSRRVRPIKEPSVWVCNHISMLDVFILLATIRSRPIKILYWKGLEANPVTRILFKSCGFIPVQMANNGAGEENEYDRSSFKEMLKSAKKAFAEGFDLGVLPEGQLNPNPERGLEQVYTGAYTLSKMSKMPIRMVGLYGTHNLWHPTNGMDPKSRTVKVRIYSQPLTFGSSEQFTKTFGTVIGHFGATGQDLPQDELQQMLSQQQ